MSDLIIVIDKSKFRVNVIDPGQGTVDPRRVHSCRCAIGAEGFRTPSDEYKLGLRTLRPDWEAPAWVEPPIVPGRTYEFGSMLNPYMHGLITLRAIDEEGIARTGYAIHGTKNEASIPGPGSHGCIRLKKSDILWLYQHTVDNTLVIIR